MNCILKSVLQSFVINANCYFEWRNEVTDNIFRSVVEKGRKPGFTGKAGPKLGDDPFDQEAVLCDREGMLALGLTIPAGDAGESVGNILDLDIQRRRVEQI